MLTLQKTASASASAGSQGSVMQGIFQNDYVCFYCDDVSGSIYEVKAHFKEEHDAANDKFKVKRMQAGKKVTSGLLECQVCGYLSPGLDRTKQRVHFHDEHPLEEVINCSKYVLRQKPSLQTTAEAPAAAAAPKVDL